MGLSRLLTYDGMTLEIVIWSLFLGIIIGAFHSLFLKKIIGSFVRKLLADDADTPENAKSLEEVGFAKNIFVRFALRNKGSLRKIVHAAPEAEPQKKFSPLSARFFIPEQYQYRADRLFDAKGSSFLVAMLAVLAFLIAALVSFTVIPDLVQMAKNVFTLS